MPTIADIAPGVAMLPGDFLPRANFYEEGGYCATDVPSGVTRNRAGTRMIALTADFLLGLRRAIVDECGPAAETVFKSCGRKWGVLFGKRFDKEMSEYYGQPLRDFQMSMFNACLVEAFSHNGFGKLTLDWSQQHQGLILIELREAIMASLVKQAERPADAMVAGILGGFFSHITGEDLDGVQTACPMRGGDTSRFIVGLKERLAPVEAWVENGKTHEEIVAELGTLRG